VRSVRHFSSFVRGSIRLVLRGNATYWTWTAFLATLIVSGVAAYSQQLRVGLALTAMRDQVSWAFYIGNFTNSSVRPSGINTPRMSRSICARRA
jgi:hypothetical protein